MGSRGDDVRVGEGAPGDSRRDEAGDVCHVREQVGTVLGGDVFHTLVVDDPGVCRGASDDDLRAIELGEFLEVVIVDQAGFNIEAVGKRLEVF